MEMRDIIWRDYNDIFVHNELLLAHLYKECNALTWDCAYKKGETRNDYGMAWGIGQWHMWHRHKAWMIQSGRKNTKDADYNHITRNKYIEDFPMMLDWRYQFRRYMSEMQPCIRDKNIDYCIRKWNWNAGLEYLRDVKRKIYIVRRLMQ